MVIKRPKNYLFINKFPFAMSPPLVQGSPLVLNHGKRPLAKGPNLPYVIFNLRNLKIVETLRALCTTQKKLRFLRLFLRLTLRLNSLPLSKKLTTHDSQLTTYNPKLFLAFLDTKQCRCELVLSCQLSFFYKNRMVESQSDTCLCRN